MRLNTRCCLILQVLRQNEKADDTACESRYRVRMNMRKRGNMWLRRNVLAGALVCFCGGVSACVLQVSDRDGIGAECGGCSKGGCRSRKYGQDAGKSGMVLR